MYKSQQRNISIWKNKATKFNNSKVTNTKDNEVDKNLKKKKKKLKYYKNDQWKRAQINAWMNFKKSQIKGWMKQRRQKKFNEDIEILEKKCKLWK
jgi:hypothetical protein